MHKVSFYKYEPSRATVSLIGRLCAAWSYVELLTERTLWGLLNLNEDLAKLFVWRMQLRNRWQMIGQQAKQCLPEQDAIELIEIGKMYSKIARQRNIIVHGLIHRRGVDWVTRRPCWTIYIGEDAGKNFPISEEAVKIILGNIEKLTERLLKFNNSHHFKKNTAVSDHVEENWPERL